MEEVRDRLQCVKDNIAKTGGTVGVGVALGCNRRAGGGGAGLGERAGGGGKASGKRAAPWVGSSRRAG